MKQIIYTPKAAEPIGPYSQAVLIGNTLYTSGQIAIEPSSGELRTSNIQEETSLVMRHLKNLLREVHMDFSNVVKCSIFIKDMNQFSQINEVYGSFFKENPPARETVEVARLPKDVNVEISCIAVKA